MIRTLTLATILILFVSGFARAAKQPVNAEDFMNMHMIELSWHKAQTTKDINLMMSLFEDDAKYITQKKTYTGKSEIRKLWLGRKIFSPQTKWVSYTPAYRLKYDLKGDTGRLYFECLIMDMQKKKIVGDVGVNADLIHADGRWLIADVKTHRLK